MQTALITGASSGIGAAFSHELAARQSNLILVARSEAKLQQLATALQTEFGIEARVVVQDLTQPDAPSAVFEIVQQQGWVVDLLVNNAGMGDYGVFSKRSLKQQSKIVKLNVVALIELTHLFLAGMQQRRYGGIINLSSISAFQPIPYLAAYSASKASILHFRQALWAENKSRGVNILAVCPGPTQTEFFSKAEMDMTAGIMANQTYEPLADIVQAALAALAAGKSHIVTGGWRNRAIANADRLAPCEVLLRALEKAFRPNMPDL